MTAQATTKKKSPIQTARESVAAELKLDIRDWRVTRLATLVAAYNTVQAELAAGEPDVDIDGLLKLDAQIEEVRKALKLTAEPMKIEIEIVRPTDAAPAGGAAVDNLVECRRCHWRPFDKDRVTCCYRCGWKHGDDTSAPWQRPEDLLPPEPPPPPKLLPTVDLVEGAGRMHGPKPTPNVVDLRRPSIHDPVVLADGSAIHPPLKKYQDEACHGHSLDTQLSSPQDRAAKGHPLPPVPA